MKENLSEIRKQSERKKVIYCVWLNVSGDGELYTLHVLTSLKGLRGVECVAVEELP